MNIILATSPSVEWLLTMGALAAAQNAPRAPEIPAQRGPYAQRWAPGSEKAPPTYCRNASLMYPAYCWKENSTFCALDYARTATVVDVTGARQANYSIWGKELNFYINIEIDKECLATKGGSEGAACVACGGGRVRF